jgi:hypothetical protein
MFNLKKITQRSLAFLTLIAILACGPVLDIDEFVSFFQPESASVDLQYYSYFFSRHANWGHGEGYQLSDRFPSSNSTSNSIDMVWAKRKEDKLFTKADETYLELANEAPGSYPDSLTRLKYLSSGLLKTLQTNYAHTKDYFLKERYGYLMVRYAFYMSLSDKTVDYFNIFVKPLKRKSFISNWALSYKAGAELRLRQDAQSFYDFAMVTLNEPDEGDYPFRMTRSFLTIPLKESLKLCRNNKEKAAVYALASVQRYIDALPYLEQIYQLDPQNPLLELLVTREINKNESIALGMPQEPDFRRRQPDLPLKNILEKDISPYFQKLRIFVEKCSKLPQYQQTAFWETANAYMAWVVRDFEGAKVYLSNAKSLKTNNKYLSNQILLQEMLLSASTMEALTPELEAQWIGYLEKFTYPKNYQHNFAFLKATQLMRQHYQAIIKPPSKSWWQFLDDKSTTQIKDIPAKLFLLTTAGTGENFYARFEKRNKDDYARNHLYPSSNHSLYSIEDSTSLNTIQQVSDFVLSPKTETDKRFVRLSGITKPYILSVLGKKRFKKQLYAEAAQAYAQVPKSYWETDSWDDNDKLQKDYFFKTNPFVVDEVGYHKDSVSTPTALCQKMAMFKRRTQQNPKDAEAWLGLALGTYNVSYYGKWWLMSKKYWSAIEPHEDYKTEYNHETGKDDKTNYFAVWGKLDEKDNYYNLNLTLAFCKKAIEVAKDKNLAAKATYLAAQCFVKDHKYDDEIGEKKDLKSKRYFYNLLKTKYSDTEFEDQIIRECATYDIFVNGRQTLSAHEENVNNPQTEEVNIVAPEPQITDSSDDLWMIFLFLGFVCLMIWVAEEL